MMSRGVDLRKQIAFEADSGFSIEDPLFRYFLSNVAAESLYKELGIEPETAERTRNFSYDIGFSFAGETRRLVEAINAQLKAEDVTTFYDYDQQAFLLALDLEHTLHRIYAESCQYYLVFLDKNYKEKVWTKYEKDIMTKGSRRGHIIPVVLDDVGAEGAVGIPTTIGRVDLRSQWSEVLSTGAISPDTMNIIRNRCVLPLLERIDGPSIAV